MILRLPLTGFSFAFKTAYISRVFNRHLSQAVQNHESYFQACDVATNLLCPARVVSASHWLLRYNRSARLHRHLRH